MSAKKNKNIKKTTTKSAKNTNTSVLPTEIVDDVKFEKLDTTNELKVIVKLKSSEWKTIQENTLKSLSSSLELKGFRKGKVPVQIAQKHISSPRVWDSAIPKLTNQALAETEKKIPDTYTTIAGPSLSVESITNDNLSLSFSYPLYPEIKNFKYKDLDLKYSPKTVTNKNVDDEIANIQRKLTLAKVKNGKATDKDIVKINYAGLLDGKPFEGGTAKEFELTLGSKTFIPGFEEKLIGTKANDSIEFEITFPKDYHAENLKNKKVKFKVDVLEVKELSVPKIDDNLAKESNLVGVSNLEELRNYFKEAVKEAFIQEERNNFRIEALNELTKKIDFAIPLSLINRDAREIKDQFIEKLKKQNLDIKKYNELTKSNDEELNKRFENEARQRIKESLIFAEISKAEDIKINENEYEEQYKKLAKAYGTNIDVIRGMITKEQMQIPMMNDKVLDVLIKNRKK